MKSGLGKRMDLWLGESYLLKRLFPRRFRYFTNRDYVSRREMMPLVSNELIHQVYKDGVQESTLLRLDFYFISNSLDKLARLSEELVRRGYESEYGKSKPWRTYGIAGTTTPVPLDILSIRSWVLEMLDLGYRYDCEFDGYEVDPHQSHES